MTNNPEWESTHTTLSDAHDPYFSDSDHDSDDEDEDEEDLHEALAPIDFDSIELDPTVRVVRLRQTPPPLSMVLRSSQSSSTS